MKKEIAVLGAILAVVGNSNALDMAYVTVGDPGNSATGIGGDGAVAAVYEIGKYEVTNAQYVEFLNFKAASDPFGLFNPSMMADPLGGILRAGASGSFTYSAKSAYQSKPVVFVSALDAARFANWLNNGQGTGDTETGAYNLSLSGSLASKEPAATVWIPSPDEWFKAAYYQPFIKGGDVDDYWAYPTRTNTRPTVSTVNSTNPNSANFGAGNPTPGNPTGTNYLTNVGSFGSSTSYYGTFDQGGNAWEWTWLEGTTSKRVIGGSWNTDADHMRPGVTYTQGGTIESGDVGFRVAAIPEADPSFMLIPFGVFLCSQRRFRKRDSSESPSASVR